MNKKGISIILAVILIVLISIFALAMIWQGVSPIVKQNMKENCYHNFANDYCLKNNMTLYSSNQAEWHFRCWTNKAKGETKEIFILADKCK